MSPRYTIVHSDDAPVVLDTETDNFVGSDLYELTDELNSLNDKLELATSTQVKVSKPESERIPEYADVYTIEEFTEQCRCGGFVNADGIGYYATKHWMFPSVGANPSDFFNDKIDHINYTHVAWFNK